MATFGGVYGILILFSGGEDTPYVAFPFNGYSDYYFRDRTTNHAFLMRPAEGQWKWLKKISYSAEYLVAFSILVSHLVIANYFRRWIEPQKNQEKDESRQPLTA